MPSLVHFKRGRLNYQLEHLKEPSEAEGSILGVRAAGYVSELASGERSKLKVLLSSLTGRHRLWPLWQIWTLQCRKTFVYELPTNLNICILKVASGPSPFFSTPRVRSFVNTGQLERNKEVGGGLLGVSVLFRATHELLGLSSSDGR